MIKTKYYFQKGFMPIGILLVIGGLVIAVGIAGALLYFKTGGFINLEVAPTKSVGIAQKQPISQLDSNTDLGSGQDSIQQVSYSDNSYDLDGILWGTEVYPDKINITKSIIDDNLKTKNLKVRFQSNFFSKDGKNFSSIGCMPSANNCVQQYNMDDIAKKFKENGWSMMPMLSYDVSKKNISSNDIDSYVNFVEWFVSRYKDDANIKYIELINAPENPQWWKGTILQLLELNNKVYDRIKSKYPDIKIGTPGFEYSRDVSNGVEMIEFFLNKNNGAKFDFWAFHGYPLMSNDKPSIVYPPTRKSVFNKYSGISGILEIRKMMDSNGWNDRLIIDTEHTGASLPSATISDENDLLDGAYLVQELLLKKTLKDNGKFVLSGIMPLKIASRGSKGEAMWASLKSDGSLSYAVESVAFFISIMNEYGHSVHINGEFDNESQAWIEKFKSGSNKELYVFFKPFIYKKNQSISFDNGTINYRLHFNNMPKNITLIDMVGNKKNINSAQDIDLNAVNSIGYLEVTY